VLPEKDAVAAEVRDGVDGRVGGIIAANWPSVEFGGIF